VSEVVGQPAAATTAMSCSLAESLTKKCETREAPGRQEFEPGFLPALSASQGSEKYPSHMGVQGWQGGAGGGGRRSSVSKQTCSACSPRVEGRTPPGQHGGSGGGESEQGPSSFDQPAPRSWYFRLFLAVCEHPESRRRGGPAVHEPPRYQTLARSCRIRIFKSMAPPPDLI